MWFLEGVDKEVKSGGKGSKTEDRRADTISDTTSQFPSNIMFRRGVKLRPDQIVC